MANSFQTEEVTSLLLAVKDGDMDAFERIYKLYSIGVLYQLRRMVKIESEAEELLQQAFIRVWERRAQIDPNQPFKPYIHRIAERLVYDFYRRLARENTLRRQLKAEIASYSPAVDNTLYNKEIRNLIDKAIDSLSPQRKKVFVLCRIEGKSYKEVGELLDLSPNTVHNHLVKASGLVKDHLLKSGIVLFPPILAFISPLYL